LDVELTDGFHELSGMQYEDSGRSAGCKY
jgi:hypothetical protein